MALLHQYICTQYLIEMTRAAYRINVIFDVLGIKPSSSPYGRGQCMCIIPSSRFSSLSLFSSTIACIIIITILSLFFAFSAHYTNITIIYCHRHYILLLHYYMRCCFVHRQVYKYIYCYYYRRPAGNRPDVVNRPSPRPRDIERSHRTKPRCRHRRQRRATRSAGCGRCPSRGGKAPAVRATTI